MPGFDIPDNDVSFHDHQSIWYSTDIDILTAGLAGVGVISGCGVTAQGSPDMTVAIAAGTIRIANSALVTVTSGNGTITTADSSNPRIDLVSASDTGTKTVTAGTAAANPKAPDLPSGHVALAMVYVPSNDTTIETDHITDKRVIFQASAWKSYTPTWATTGTAPSLGNGNLQGHYRMLDGKTCMVRVYFVPGSTTTFGTGTWSFALPFNAVSGVQQTLPMWIVDTGTDNKAGVAHINSAGSTIVELHPEAANVVTNTVPMTWVSGDILVIQGIYEIA